jgi:hypothetical protein
MGNCFGTPATLPSSTSPPVQAGHPQEMVRPAAPTHQPPIPSSVPSQASSVTSLPKGSSQRPTRGTAQHEGERLLLVTPERVRSQTLQHPRPQEMNLQQYSSGGMDSSQRNRARSMNTPQGERSQLSGQRPRTASASASSQEGRRRFPSTLQNLLSNDFRYAVRRCPISHYYYGTIVHRFRILVVGMVRVV